MENELLYSAKIIQMLPAEDYAAYFYLEDWKEGDPKYPHAFWKAPLVCWALVEHKDEDKTREVTGMTLDFGSSVLTFAGTSDNFMGYGRMSDADADWHKTALEDIESERVRKVVEAKERRKFTEICNMEQAKAWADKDCKRCDGNGFLKDKDGPTICYCILHTNHRLRNDLQGRKEIQKLMEQAATAVSASR